MSKKRLASELWGKPQKPVYTAYFDDLVDIVLNDDDIKFLLANGDVIDERMVDNTQYYPPPIVGLPPKNYFQIPRLSQVQKYIKLHDESDKTDDSYVCKGCGDLFDSLLEYHKNISELPDYDLYILLVLWDFHTYLIEKANYSPIIYFYSVAERGKSRTLKGMTYVAYRGIRKGDIRDSQLIRDCTNLRASLTFDMMDFWEKVKQSGSQDVILNRYERGTTVSRINRPEKGAFQDTDYYDVFGPTVIATNEIIHEIVDTRSIPIVMKKSDREFNNEVTPEVALPYKEQLTAFRAAHFNDNLPTVDRIAKSRLGDIVWPLYQILMKVKPSKEKEFKELIKRIEDTRLTEKSSSISAEIILALSHVRQYVEHGVIASQKVTDFFNQEKEEKEKIKSRRVATVLSSLGFTKTRTGTSAVGFYWDDKLVDKLLKEYGVLALELSESSESSEMSDI